MKNIENYIIEKLKLKKETNFITIIDKIKDIIKNYHYESKDTMNEILSNIINWLDKNKITNIECVMQRTNYQEHLEYFDSSLLGDFVRLDYADFNYFNDKTRKLIYDNGEEGIDINDIVSLKPERAFRLAFYKINLFMIFAETI